MAYTSTDPDKLPEDLGADPVKVTDMVVLHGWLGEDTDPASVRLYLTPHLNDYVIMLKTQIVGRFKVADGEMHSYVSVKKAAALRRVRVDAQMVQTSFLAGELSHGQPPQGTSSEPPRPGYHWSHLAC